MPAPRARRGAAAGLALAALLAAAALPAALAAPSCGARVRAAMDACHRDMMAIVDAVQAGGPAPSASSLAPSEACCGAATGFFAPEFMEACGCSDEVASYAAMAPPAALEALRALTEEKCGAPAAPLPECAVRRRLLQTANGPAAYAPVGGSGSYCVNPGKCLRPVCRSKYSTEEAYQKAYARLAKKCNTKQNNGFCISFASQNLTESEVKALYPDLFYVPQLFPGTTGLATCANVNGTVDVVQGTPNPKNASEICSTCCQVLGTVIPYVVQGERSSGWDTSRIYPNKNKCSKRAESGCFPGSARVALASGKTKAMRHLAVGDSVLVARPDGSLAFEDVYFFDHELDGGAHSFRRIELDTGAALELTSGHFVPVGEALATARMTRARDVAAGMRVLVARPGGAAPEAATVAAVSEVTRAGVFAPVTASGTVVVNGVVASAYSDWILDGLFDFFGVPEKLPAAMHLVHAPLRLGYAALGPKALRALSPIISGIAQLDARQIAAGLGMQVSA
ncbi:hypothetical protein Rsub_05610 [Raphidocelis subcapitata]|uniref:Hint domain-containing protein n=1 Tax=Raphidocelis subcapitata TaxID=307507 RepID=A0A2V0NXP6_9CHLO|nr:hypothetical protein Rsub_05610 [Raphidocelis subcapitata]|eukprot:GBF92408.1 hypothetical protein Rsub_05610 [Raphidocelis subcapitata]